MTAQEQARLKSSFIYLANAVRDLTGNWQTFALTLGPLAFAAALCLMPDALNLQHQLMLFLSPGVHNVSLRAAQAIKNGPQASLPFSPWQTRLLHLIIVLLTLAVNLVVLCALSRIRAGVRENSALDEARAIYRRAWALVGPFAWVFLLQVFTTLVGLFLLVIPGVLAYVWLYFAQYAVVMDNQRSWPALLFSRELMRGRFFAVAARIVVFLAVWSGFNSWTGGAFVLVSWTLGIIGVVTGFLWAGMFAADLLATCVGYATIAFFFAAGARLYEDLNHARRTRLETSSAPALAPTESLGARPA
jgi:hypothetical protein